MSRKYIKIFGFSHSYFSGHHTWPIVGNLPELCKKRLTFLWIESIIQKLATDIGCIRLGNVLVTVVKSLELALEFLVKKDNVFLSRPLTMATEYVSRGFLGMAVSPWGSHSNKDCSVVNLRFALRHYSVNILRGILFSRRFFGRGGGDEEAEHLDAVFTILRCMYVFTVSDYLPSLRIIDVAGHQKTIKDAMSVFNKYHDPIIEKRIEQRRNGKKHEPENLLDVMITLKDERGRPLLSPDEIKAQCTVS
ncbi:unnamed protein product [Coffea canephora]|uniref:Uncharacterized protein n=1 Tax=Coffea canephora TaxID=49390 RepID=A0A068UXV2_COFCA|nr:unnamed protein product [Coffea canephora]